MSTANGKKISELNVGRDVQDADLFVTVQDGVTVYVTGAQVRTGGGSASKYVAALTGLEPVILAEEHGLTNVSVAKVFNPDGYEVHLGVRIVDGDVQLTSLIDLTGHTLYLE